METNVGVEPACVVGCCSEPTLNCGAVTGVAPESQGQQLDGTRFMGEGRKIIAGPESEAP